MYKYVKRLIDITVSIIGLIISLPIMIIVSIAIKLDSNGPVIFKQKRLGRHGEVFNMYKFRSMTVNAEKDGVYESENDPRVTRVGNILRKTSLDELPQFVNILIGDMSLIGPRPVLTYHPWELDKYTIEQRKMFDVRPGITGWAQVNGRKSVEWNKRIELNVEYVNKCSLIFDTKIFFITILKVLRNDDNINEFQTLIRKDK